MKIVKYIEESVLLIKGVSKLIRNGAREQEVNAAIRPHPLTNSEIKYFYQNEPKFNGIYSRYNLPKIKDEACVILMRINQ